MGSREEFYLSEEAAEWIGLKKSEYLSLLISSQVSSDFSFEEFHRFDHLIPSTISLPDQIYLSSEETFPIQTFVRTYPDQGTFHQVVIGGLFPDREKGSEVFVPILTFITRVNELVGLMSPGKLQVRSILN